MPAPQNIARPRSIECCPECLDPRLPLSNFGTREPAFACAVCEERTVEIGILWDNPIFQAQMIENVLRKYGQLLSVV